MCKGSMRKCLVLLTVAGLASCTQEVTMPELEGECMSRRPGLAGGGGSPSPEGIISFDECSSSAESFAPAGAR